jgi:uncharacterized membrane protein YdjX (TVP38/TMEM64 family)
MAALQDRGAVVVARCLPEGSVKKIFLALLLVSAIALYFGLGVDQHLSLHALKESQGEFIAMLEQSPLRVTVIAFVAYLLVVALSLPGATIMGLAAGALFGLWYGVLFVSFASSIGATLAFLMSRYLLRDFVESHFGDRLKIVNDGIAKDGELYLFMLRLVPLFPFFLINLLMGLTQIRTRTFYWVSQAGMLAGSTVVVNAGAQLARINSLSDVFSPKVMLSLTLLGVFPLIAKLIVQAIRK